MKHYDIIMLTARINRKRGWSIFVFMAHEIREIYQIAFFIGDSGSVEALKPALKSLALGDVPGPILPKEVQRYVMLSCSSSC
ncbi:hypothetical protein SGGMMB4_04479 [Sodalis glossinidius str. 'morsitans']|uniref:Uncharacterized protein n=1 Tax=Sodalis glossinidius (strain morsitans) TaxID=343509 RepID=A0A193QLU1_SODGM|nr:hypothetical protein SGGMMB4_01118 [Sodalis glossinidius str. 'morsitans']CRL46132.1 hypothetical protein SGGMMB4_04479 [Sodalis glossinidius str. 'morsitans']